MILSYIDPGTGSALLQMLIAGLLGGAFVIKQFWQRIRAALSLSRDTERG